MTMRTKKYVCHRIHSQRVNQRGAVLLVGLVMLLIVTLVGVSSMESVTLDEKVVGSMQSSTKAYYGAESALANCESSLQAGSITSFTFGTMPTNWQTDTSVWAHSNVSVVDFSGVSTTTVETGLASAARCVSEFIGDGGSNVDVKQGYRADNPSARPVFRVTSWSNGGDSRVEAMMESLFVCPAGCGRINTVAYR